MLPFFQEKNVVSKTSLPQDNLHNFVHECYSILLWPVLFTGLLQIVAIHVERSEIIAVLCHVALIIFVAIQAARMHITWQKTVVIAGIAGGISIMIPTIYILITQFRVIQIFAIFTKPIFVGMIDALATGLLFTGIQLILEQKKLNNSKKKGEK